MTGLPPSLSGNNIIDTSNATKYTSALSAGQNISFVKRMSALLYAAYGRDNIAASYFKDSTTFTVSSKNGADPNAWRGGISSFPKKNDLVGVFAHMPVLVNVESFVLLQEH